MLGGTVHETANPDDRFQPRSARPRGCKYARLAGMRVRKHTYAPPARSVLYALYLQSATWLRYACAWQAHCLQIEDTTRGTLFAKGCGVGAYRMRLLERGGACVPRT